MPPSAQMVRTDTKHHNQRVQRCVVMGASNIRTEVPSGNTVPPRWWCILLNVDKLLRMHFSPAYPGRSLFIVFQYSTFNTADCHWVVYTTFMLTNHKYLFKGRHKLDIIKRTITSRLGAAEYSPVLPCVLKFLLKIGVHLSLGNNQRSKSNTK